MPLLGYRVDDFLRRGVFFDRDDIDPRHHDIAGGCLLQSQHVVNHLALFGLDDAVVGGVSGQEKKLVLGSGGNSVGAFSPKRPGEQIGGGVGNGRQGTNKRGDEMRQTQQRSGRCGWPGAGQGARNGLTKEEEEDADDEYRDCDGATTALAHDDEGDQARGKCDSDRLHKLKSGDKRPPRIEQRMDASLATGASRGLAESVAADQSRAGFDGCRTGHHQQRK
jgi:hypothetical protein